MLPAAMLTSTGRSGRTLTTTVSPPRQRPKGSTDATGVGLVREVAGARLRVGVDDQRTTIAARHVRALDGGPDDGRSPMSTSFDAVARMTTRSIGTDRTRVGFTVGAGSRGSTFTPEAGLAGAEGRGAPVGGASVGSLDGAAAMRWLASSGATVPAATWAEQGAEVGIVSRFVRSCRQSSKLLS